MDIKNLLSTLGQIDAVEWLKQQADESVDLMITDIPYESLEKHRKIGTTTRLKNSKAPSNPWFEIFPNDRLPELFAEIYRVMKKNTHFYFICDQETMFVAKPLAEAAGFKFWKPIVWDKQAIGMGYHYRAQCEFVLFFEKGKRKLNNLSTSDVISFKRLRGGYPTEKPVELIKTLIEQSSKAGEVVCDPFFGSGVALVASYELDRIPTGNDLSLDAHKHLADRLKALAATGKELLIDWFQDQDRDNPCLVLPRLVIDVMPNDWQLRLHGLLKELDNTVNLPRFQSTSEIDQSLLDYKNPHNHTAHFLKKMGKEKW